MARGPDLTAVTVGVRGAASLLGVLAALRRQTIAERVEVVAVIPPGAQPPSPDGFFGVRVAELGEADTTGAAIARGVKLAGAPVVAYSEEHSWPEAEWAERLLDAHDGRRAAVAWTLVNANPGSSTSWTHLISDFSHAVDPTPPGLRRTLPWHHTSYRSEVLLAYGDELGEMLEVEWRVHADLLKRGEALYLEAAARSRHWNISRLPAQVVTEARGGRTFGASRVAAGRWSAIRRTIYALAAPLIFLLRLRVAGADLRRIRPPHPLRVGAMLSLLLTVSTLAEVSGYLFGFGDARRRRTGAELDRAGYLNGADRRAWATELDRLADLERRSIPSATTAS